MTNQLRFTEQQERDTFRKTIIIVEDDPSNAEVLDLLLQQADASYQITCFSTASEALASLDIIKSLSPLLFVLDYQLPPITGLDLYVQLHTVEGLENVPALILSGRQLNDEHKERISHLGLILIPKPYNIDDLLATIKQVIA